MFAGAKSIHGLSLGCPMAWSVGGSRSLCCWAPELLLATAVKQITALELELEQAKGNMEGGKGKKGTSLSPPETWARHPPSRCACRVKSPYMGFVIGRVGAQASNRSHCTQSQPSRSASLPAVRVVVGAKMASRPSVNEACVASYWRHACSQDMEASGLVPRTLALITEQPRINGNGYLFMYGHVRHRMESV
ncbi:hypothetical protein Trihar35433_8107 [Trichoderma harzianum]|nr:hypothetical protein Trihar35433_8107 [Trichoderma harzianum]